MFGEKFSATASIDKATSGDAVHSLVLKVRLTEDETLGLVDAKWYEDLCKLTAKHGGVGINPEEIRAGYDPGSSSHYDSVLKKLQERFAFGNPR